MQSKIDALWDWFEANKSKILDCFSEDHSIHQEFVVDGLNDLILDLGMFTWEIGQNDVGMFMIISPNRDAELLKLSRKIVSSAPDTANWVFHSSRPSIFWNRVFTVHDELMDEQNIDASSWQFHLEKPPTGKAEIMFYGNCVELDEEAKSQAAEKVLINEIGEENRILMVNSAFLNSMQEMKNETRPLSELRATLNLPT